MKILVFTTSQYFFVKMKKIIIRHYVIHQTILFRHFYRLVTNLYTQVISKWYLSIIRKQILSIYHVLQINSLDIIKIAFALTTLLHSKIFQLINARRSKVALTNVLHQMENAVCIYDIEID